MELNDLIEKCKPPLYSYAIRTARISSLVDDAVQEACLHIWKVHTKDPTKVDGYYYRAGTNYINSFFRYESYTSVYPKAPEKKRDPLKHQDTTVFSGYSNPEWLAVAPDPATEVIHRETLQAAVRGVVENLDEPERNLVFRRFYQGYTMKEIAAEFGRADAVWTKMKKKLVVLLEPYREEINV